MGLIHRIQSGTTTERDAITVQNQQSFTSMILKNFGKIAFVGALLFLALGFFLGLGF